MIINTDGQETLQTEMMKVENDTINVGNEPGVALPNAGGPGSLLFRVTGTILFGIAVLGLLTKRAKRQKHPR